MMLTTGHCMMDVTSMYCLDKLNLYLALVKSSYLEQQVNSIWALSKENLIMLHVNNTGADQPAHLASLISTLMICSCESIIVKFAACKISILWLVSLVEQAGLSLIW